jgi:hypothetical protein
MVISSSLPMLKIGPTVPSDTISRLSAPTTSFASAKHLLYWPVPNTRFISLLSASVTKLGNIMPYRPVCGGPTVLNNQVTNHRQPLFVPTRKGEKLLNRLGRSIAPSAMGRRPDQ